MRVRFTFDCDLFEAPDGNYRDLIDQMACQIFAFASKLSPIAGIPRGVQTEVLTSEKRSSKQA